MDPAWARLNFNLRSLLPADFLSRRGIEVQAAEATRAIRGFGKYETARGAPHKKLEMQQPRINANERE